MCTRTRELLLDHITLALGRGEPSKDDLINISILAASLGRDLRQVAYPHADRFLEHADALRRPGLAPAARRQAVIDLLGWADELAVAGGVLEEEE